MGRRALDLCHRETAAHCGREHRRARRPGWHRAESRIGPARGGTRLACTVTSPSHRPPGRSAGDDGLTGGCQVSTHIPAFRLLPREGVSPWIEVIPAVTPDERLAALEIRRRVFAEEQGVADLRVSDSDDARSLIALATFPPAATSSGNRLPVSTGRITLPFIEGGQALVAWVATIPEARSHGASG